MIRKEIGLKAGLSQRDLAEKSGLTQNTIYKIENGKFSVGIDVLCKATEALGKKLDII